MTQTSGQPSPSQELSGYRQIKEYEAAAFNAGGSANPQCPKCKDKHYIMEVREGTMLPATVLVPCECKSGYDSQRAISKSGLTDKLKGCTFGNFEVNKGSWQLAIKQSALQFVKDGFKNGAWFFIGGQVGCGKTHICTAIMNDIMERGARAKYMVWPEEVDSIKGNAEGFSEKLDFLMEVPVLYIDDFLKSPNGQTRSGKPPAPTDGELNAAFKLINYRYNRPDKVTLISSEFFTDEIRDFDSGLASRIYERCNKRPIEIERSEDKNMRFAT